MGSEGGVQIGKSNLEAFRHRGFARARPPVGSLAPRGIRSRGKFHPLFDGLALAGGFYRQGVFVARPRRVVRSVLVGLGLNLSSLNLSNWLATTTFWQTLEDSFSAVPTPTFASVYSYLSEFRRLFSFFRRDVIIQKMLPNSENLKKIAKNIYKN